MSFCRWMRRETNNDNSNQGKRLGNDWKLFKRDWSHVLKQIRVVTCHKICKSMSVQIPDFSDLQSCVL